MRSKPQGLGKKLKTGHEALKKLQLPVLPITNPANYKLQAPWLLAYSQTVNYYWRLQQNNTTTTTTYYCCHKLRLLITTTTTIQLQQQRPLVPLQLELRRRWQLPLLLLNYPLNK